MLVALFWLSLALLVYIYFGYPLLARMVATLWPNPVRKNPEHQPKVSILIAAYNEAKDIEATLQNKLALDYPSDKLEILVISDESDDGTDAIVERVAASAPFPIRLFRQVPRQGKTAGLNTLIPEANGEIILFSDANSQWDTYAVSRLCSNLADPKVGYVTGKMVYVNEDGSLVGDGCSAYMKYENWLREQETLIGSVVGVDGGIDAMRKELYQPLRADQLPDFVQPLKVVEQGYRVVYEPEALLKEEALNDSDSEFSMRVRVSLRALWALKDMRHLMNPLRDPLYAWQLVSHKLLRYAAFIPLATLAAATLLLAPARGIYTLAFLGLVVFLALAWTGHKREAGGESLSVIYSIPYYFMLLNVASCKACVAFLKGEKKVIWNPRKG
ncbi:glycosyltransferase family 2 protein [Marinobacter sp. HL-58]|uniref:glycosyltransferase family 2 protein n=1 Tax=Marinobacter sp. HL-58 TaxID=1479237 RepID=UPI00048526E1|nr:glycosyltransferase family 2 protein [Marinobacter sp. HL-58]KPQ01349.1 MAG: group 2 family glycosyl transferase [Marinobacter sp. HL-58]